MNDLRKRLSSCIEVTKIRDITTLETITISRNDLIELSNVIEKRISQNEEDNSQVLAFSSYRY